MKNKELNAKSLIKSAKNEKNRQTWRETTEKNGVTKEISVEELDNGGYLVRINIYGDIKDKKGVYHYYSTDKKLYSEENPLEPDNDPLDKLVDSLIIR